MGEHSGTIGFKVCAIQIKMFIYPSFGDLKRIYSEEMWYRRKNKDVNEVKNWIWKLIR